MYFLIPGGRFCSFSPCIEQVQRTCLALQDHGFQEISTMEVLQTEIKITRRTIPVRDLSFLKQKVSDDRTFFIFKYRMQYSLDMGYYPMYLPIVFVRLCGYIIVDTCISKKKERGTCVMFLTSQ